MFSRRRKNEIGSRLQKEKHPSHLSFLENRCHPFLLEVWGLLWGIKNFYFDGPKMCISLHLWKWPGDKMMMCKGVEKQIQPRIILNYPWKNIFLWVTGTSVMTTQSLQLPKNPAQGFWPPLHLHQFLHSFGLKNSNQFEKFQPLLKKSNPRQIWTTT